MATIMVMGAAQRAADRGPSVGIVSEDRSLVTRIGKILVASGCKIGFTISPDEVDQIHGGKAVEVVVVTGALGADSTPIARARRAFPRQRLVACIPTDEALSIRRVLDAGVDGIVWSSRLDQTLAPTVRAVDAGMVVVPQDSVRRGQRPELTNREKQALSMVLMGLTNREIALKLFVSENTVKSHLNTAYRKLGVHSRAEAARLIADPEGGLGTGILAITGSGLARGHSRNR